MKPMLAVPSKGGNTTAGLEGWIADLKLDGLRCIADWDGREVTLTNRNEVDITRKFPDVEVVIARALAGWGPTTIDGEIIANDGTFTSVATRGKQEKDAAIAKALTDLPVTFVQFDTMRFDGQDITDLPLLLRRERAFAGIAQVLSHGDAAWFFEQVKSQGLEGIIAKDPMGRYHWGKRFPGWVKVKAVRTVTVVITGYDLGKGARAHFGAAHLKMLDGSTVVDVGRVGTGFTDAEIRWLKAELDAGRPVVTEIECLNRTADNKLRFPVYLGTRTDLSVGAATIDQLSDLPIC